MDHDSVDRVLANWRQGDCLLGEAWFVHRFLPDLPLTDAAAEAALAGVDLVETPVAGFMVLAQTCDIVRRCQDRPYVEVAPLVHVGERVLEEIRRGRRPAYAYVPGLADRRLVADLDRVMTVEKAVVARWERTSGCDSDEAARSLAQTLLRKRSRFAFPDDFTAIAAMLQDRLLEKHDKRTPEGAALRALREIRVRAAPSWEADPIDLTLWFIRNEVDEEFEGAGWDSLLNGWLGLLRLCLGMRPIGGQSGAGSPGEPAARGRPPGVGRMPGRGL